jgi:hypothetical protein
MPGVFLCAGGRVGVCRMYAAAPADGPSESPLLPCFVWARRPAVLAEPVLSQ